MASIKAREKAAGETGSPWREFQSGLWQKGINVRDFIQTNYRPYVEDESFLAPATERTQKIWKRLQDLFVEERRKGRRIRTARRRSA